MYCQNLFSGKNKKNISICCMQKILHRVLSINVKISVVHLLKVHFYAAFRGHLLLWWTSLGLLEETISSDL